MSWIKIETHLLNKPEVIQLSEILKIDEYGIIGRLVSLWCWADIQTIDGHAIGVTDSFIDRHVSVTGFAEAMRKVGWLSGENGALMFPNFERHNGKSAKRRGLDSDRQSRHRHAKNVTQSLPDKIREDKNKSIYSKRPTLEQVLSQCQLSGIPESVGKEFWNHFESTGWIDKNGHKVESWVAKLQSWWIRKQNDEAEKVFHSRKNLTAKKEIDYSKGF